MGKSKKSSSTTEASNPGLSTFLLAQAEGKDSALEDIFASSVSSPETLSSSQQLTDLLHGLQSGPSLAYQPKKLEEKKKINKPISVQQEDVEMQEDTAVGDDEDEVLSEVDSDASLEMPSSDEEDEEEEAGLEEAYAAKLVAQRLKAEAEGIKSKKRKAEEELEEDESEDGEDDGPLDINDLVHESLAGKKTKEEKKGKKDKVIDPKKAEKAKKRAEETPDERDSRTIFIGNVPSDCSTSNVRLVVHYKQALDNVLTMYSRCSPERRR